MKNTPILLLFTLFCELHFNSQIINLQKVTKIFTSKPKPSVEKKLWVYFFKDYQNSRKRYPVLYTYNILYLFDTTSFHWDEWKTDELPPYKKKLYEVVILPRFNNGYFPIKTLI